MFKEKKYKKINKKILIKYIGQCLVNFFDHIIIPTFHLSSLESNTTPKKNPKICVLFLIRKV